MIWLTTDGVDKEQQLQHRRTVDAVVSLAKSFLGYVVCGR